MIGKVLILITVFGLVCWIMPIALAAPFWVHACLAVVIWKIVKAEEAE